MIKEGFVYPYNFVPVTNKGPKRKVREQGALTGYIDCCIKVKSALFLPDMNAKLNNDGYYDIYKINKEVVIPGSEIRGCVRSVFEAITDSCFSTINHDTDNHDTEENFGKYLPCPCRDNKPKYCAACNLFGTINHGAVASRISFFDAKAENVRVSDYFYMIEGLRQPNAKVKKLYFINGKIWGRKFYVHSSSKLRTITQRNPYDKFDKAVKKAVKAIEEGSTFSFKVFFNSITREELNALRYALTLGENNAESNYCHKIGAAKPLGAGSIKITVSETKLRVNSDDGFYQLTDDTFDIKSDLIDDPSAENMKKMASLHLADGKRVQYRYIEEKGYILPTLEEIWRENDENQIFCRRT